MIEPQPISEPPARAPRPFWQWVLLAIAPGLISDVIGAIEALLGAVRAHSVLQSLEPVLIFAMMAMPVAAIVWLIALSGRYYAGRDDAAGARVLFVLGFLVVNGFLWGGGCAMMLGSVFRNGMH